VETAGAAGHYSVLTQEIFTGPGRVGLANEQNAKTMPVEKSDYLMVAMKPGNAGGAKGITKCKESDNDNWNWCLPPTLTGTNRKGAAMGRLQAYLLQKRGCGV
jgi:hypothetical protein